MHYIVRTADGNHFDFVNENAKVAKRVIEHALDNGAKITSPLELVVYSEYKEEVQIVPSQITAISMVNWKD